MYFKINFLWGKSGLFLSTGTGIANDFVSNCALSWTT